MFINKISLRTALNQTLKTVCLTALLMPLVSHGYTIFTKPGTPQNAAEYGTRVAAYGDYSLVGAMQDAGARGTVHLHYKGGATPLRTYQLPNGPTYAQWGAGVAISDHWLTFTATNTTLGDNAPAKVYIVGKTNGQWGSCLNSSGVQDCTNFIQENGQNLGRPITSISFDASTEQYAGYYDLNVAISGDTLAIANIKKSLIHFYHYDGSQWVLEYTADGNDNYGGGTGLAVEDNRVVVSYPKFNNGYVILFERNITGDWSAKSIVSNTTQTTQFGNALAMDNSRLMVAAGAQEYPGDLSFYTIGSNGLISAPVDIFTFNYAPTRIALENDKAATTFSNGEATVELFAFGNNHWVKQPPLSLDLVGPDYSGSTFFATDLGLGGGVLAMGWRGRWLETTSGVTQLVGALVRRSFNYSTACNTPNNIVPNCSFSEPSATNWSLLNHNGGSSWANYANSQMKAVISYGGNDYWHVQARTPVKVYSPGDYTLRFRAKADSARTIVVNLGHNGSNDNNWTSYSKHTLPLTNTFQWFTVPMQNIPTDINSVLDFNYGNNNTSVTLDDVSLIKNY